MDWKMIGTKKFGNKIDITDPCYDMDVWCRINDVEIEPGIYTCHVNICHDRTWGDRVAELMICKSGASLFGVRKSTNLGAVGVDSGMCGFFEHKPDYTDEEWISFCEHTFDGANAWINDNGFFSRSGYGDGAYKAISYQDHEGKTICLKLVFIEE